MQTMMKRDGLEQWVDEKNRWHRTDGPAVVKKSAIAGNTYTAWFLNGKRHRTDGPAVILDDPVDGFESWWLNGKRHRTDGPAYITVGGVKEFYLNGKKISWGEWRKAVTKG